MSVEAITWALRQPVKQSSTKFVLVVLANCASAANSLAYPSVAYLSEATGQNRKTIIVNLQRLQADGFIEDTGERRGTTRQVVVYRLRIEVQRDGDLLTERHYCYRCEEIESGRFYIGVRTCLGEPSSDAGYVGSGRWVQSCKANGFTPTKAVLAVFTSRLAAEEAERSLIAAAIDDPLCMNRVIPPKRTENGIVSNGTENGIVETVPVSAVKSPETGAKGSLKGDTEPLGTVSNRQKKALVAVDVSAWPSQPSPKVLTEWLAHRAKKRAPVTETVIESFGEEIAKCMAVDLSLNADHCLKKCMARNWQGFEAEWLLRDLPRAQMQSNQSAPAPTSKVGQGIAALENLKRGNRMAAGRDRDGAAETTPALAGPGTRC